MENLKGAKETVQLGDKVRDSVTGYEGIVIGKTMWLYGCLRCGVVSQELKDGKPIETQWFDEPQLIVLEKTVVKRKNDDAKTDGPDEPGGPRPAPQRNSDPAR